ADLVAAVDDAEPARRGPDLALAVVVVHVEEGLDLGRAQHAQAAARAPARPDPRALVLDGPREGGAAERVEVILLHGAAPRERAGGAGRAGVVRRPLFVAEEPGALARLVRERELLGDGLGREGLIGAEGVGAGADGREHEAAQRGEGLVQ